MAQLNTEGISDIVSWMERTGSLTGEMAEEMLEAAVDVIKQAWKDEIQKQGFVDTGAMLDSVEGDSPTRLGNVLVSTIYPRGKDGKGVRNAEKAFILHYGKHGFPGTYWVDDAEAVAEDKAVEVIQEIFYSHVGGE